MKKHRVFGTAAMIVSAVLIVGTVDTVFAAANEAMLTNEIERTIEVAASNALPEASMTAQEAADIGAEYFWRVFGYSSKENKYFMNPAMEVQNFSLRGRPSDVYDDINPLAERAVWNGNVQGALCFMFSMDAITGEILSVHLEDLTPPDEQVAMRLFDSQEGAEFWNNNRDEYLEIAQNTAEKHLQTKIVSAEFEATIALGVDYSVDSDGEFPTVVNESGEEVLLAEHNLLDIRVTDENGKEIIVGITDNTKEIYEIYNADAIPLTDLERNAELRAEWGYK